MGIKTSRRHLSRAAARNIAAVTKTLVPASRKKTAQKKQTKPTKLGDAKNQTKVAELSSEKSFKCSKCNASFLLRSQLTTHAKQKHNKKTKKTKEEKLEAIAVEEVTTTEANLVLKQSEYESASPLTDKIDIVKCEDIPLVEDEQTSQPSMLECYIVNENAINQGHEPEFVDVYTVVEVKEVEIEQEESEDRDIIDEKDVTDEETEAVKKKSPGGSSCEFCGRTFRHKKNIRPHINKKHPDQVIVNVPDTSNYFACEFCERKFKYRKNLNAHIRLKHPEAVIKPVIDGDRPYECHLCDRKLKYKRNLNAHIRSKHLVLFPGDYTCNSCDRRFLFRKNLLVHLRNRHPTEIDQSPLLPCNSCGETFKTTSSLRKHKSSEHPLQAPLSVFPKKCPLCDFFTSQKLPIIRHFADIHDIQIEVTHIEFQEMATFYDWKENLERETNCKYTKISTGKFEDHTTLIFQCHRSGRSRKNRNSNGIFSKSSMSLKMNAYCPAQIYVVDYYTEIKVRYTSTHVGHDNEMTIRRLDSKNRSLLSLMIQEDILQSQYEQTTEEIQYVEPKEIVLRMGNKSKIDEKTRSVEMKTIDDWVKVHNADVLYYKKTGDADELVLYEGELILIIMSKEQRSTMRTYGHKFVCVHTIHDRLKYAFTWTTIMVLDNFNQAVPVAYLVSNRTSAEIYQVFFQNVMSASDLVQPEVFMGDKNEEMYWAWSEVCRPAEQFLFCPWQVLDDWRYNANKIADEVKRKSIMNLLEHILIEEKYEAFEDELNSFIECSDDEVQKFREYFIENYMETIPAWAYCYRMDVRVEGNLTRDSFKKIFTPSNTQEGGEDLISVTEALLTLDKYNALKNSRVKEGSSVQIVGLDGLIEIIQDNHKRALNCGFEADKVLKTEEGWLLSSTDSTSGVELTYKIHKNEVLPCSDCKIACPTCNECFHRFSCSCIDNSKKLSMCDHVHFVGELLRTGIIA